MKTKVNEAIAAKREVLQDEAITMRLARERVDVTLPVRPSPAEVGRIHPISQVMDENHRDFCRYGFFYR